MEGTIIPQIFSLLSSLLILGLGFFVFRKDIKKPINILFFLISVVFTIWEIGTFMMFGAKTNKEIVFWDRIVYLGVVFVPVIQYHFSLAATRYTSKRKVMLVIAYFLSFIFLLVSRTNYFIDGVFRYQWGAHSIARIGHHLFLAYFFFYVFALLYNFFIEKRLHQSMIEIKRINYFIIGFVFLNIVGGIAYLPAYSISVYPFALASPTVFALIISYSIINYRLMNLRIVLRQSVVYFGSLFSTCLVVFIFKYSFNYFLPEISYILDFIILLVALVIFPVLKRYSYRLANKFFFTSLYDAKKVIATLSEELSSTLDNDKIFEATDRTLSKAFHSKGIAIFQFNKSTNNFDLVYSFALFFKKQSFRFNRHVMNNFLSQNNVFVIEDLKDQDSIKYAAFIKEYRDKYGIDLIAPMVLKHKIVGFIALGPKESGDMYDLGDTEMMAIVANQVAISLENATLFEETKNFNSKLTKEVEKATHELRTANQELKKLDEAKSEFISIASHQLRTPLTVIKGYSSMMLEGSFGKIQPPIISDNIQKIFESSQRLTNLVEDLLNISRIESGRLNFAFTFDDLEPVVASVVEELESTAKAKNIYLKYEKPTTNLPLVKIDKNKIRQVIINIIDNSIKYTQSGGVTVRLIELGDFIRFSTIDTGMGIKPELLQQLFQKFSRGEETSVIHTEGIGLGLYVGKMMIEEHGGRIWAESAGEGKGSTFSFELPIAKQPELIKDKQVEPLIVK